MRSAELRMTVKKDAGIKVVYIQRRKIFALFISNSTPATPFCSSSAFAYEITFFSALANVIRFSVKKA